MRAFFLLCFLVLSGVAACGNGEIADSAPTTPSTATSTFVRSGEATWPAIDNRIGTPLCIVNGWCSLFFSDGTYQTFSPSGNNWGLAPMRLQGAVVGEPTSFAAGTNYALLGGREGYSVLTSGNTLKRFGPSAYAAVAPCHTGFCVASTVNPNALSAGFRLDFYDADMEPFNSTSIAVPGVGVQQCCAPVVDGVAAPALLTDGRPRCAAVLYRRFLKTISGGVTVELRLHVTEYDGLRYAGVNQIQDVLLEQRALQVGGATSCASLYADDTVIKGQSLSAFGKGVAVAYTQKGQDSSVYLLVIGYEDQDFLKPLEKAVPFRPGTIFQALRNSGQLVAVVPDHDMQYANFVAVLPSGESGSYLSLDNKISWTTMGTYGQDAVIVITQSLDKTGRPLSSLTGRLLRHVSMQ